MITNQIKRFFASLFLTNGFNAFYYNADDDAVFPYFVYELREVDAEQGHSRFVLECNGWDKLSPAALNDVFDALEALLDEYGYIDNRFRLNVYKQGIRQEVPDPDKNIRHHRILFEVRLTRRNKNENV